MFQRHAFGSISPFQPWGSAINPFFQYGVGANPFLQFAGGISPLQQVGGLMGQIHPLLGPPSFNPLGAALNPFVSQAFGPQQLPFTYGPGVWPGGGLGLQSPASQYGYGVLPMNPFGGQVGGFGNNPFPVDPITSPLPLHQFSQYPVHLPIRPLAGQNPLEQIQGLAGSPIAGQPVDPYNALINPQVIPPLANPFQQVGRSHYGSPFQIGGGQVPIGNPFIPFGI